MMDLGMSAEGLSLALMNLSKGVRDSSMGTKVTGTGTKDLILDAEDPRTNVGVSRISSQNTDI